MAKKDTSFIFFKDWAVLIDSLNAEDRLYFWDLFSKCDTQVVCEKDTVKPVWNFIVSQLNKMQENYQSNIVERNQNNGKLGGRPSKDKGENPNNPMGLKKPKEPKLTQKTLNRIESNIIEDNKIEDNKNSVPAFDLFLSYALENKPNVSKQALELKYKAWVVNGWKDGNDKAIKNWKTKLLNTLPHIEEGKPIRKEGEQLNPQSYYL